MCSGIPAAGRSLAPTDTPAPEIRAQTWFNAGRYKKPSLKAMRGKVVLVFFWTMDDSNCSRAVETVNQWYSNDREKGLEVIGVYTPEFDFTFSESGLFQKMDSLKIKFPVAVEPDSMIRTEYDVTGWPSFCLVDRGGFLRSCFPPDPHFADLKVALEALLEEKAP